MRILIYSCLFCANAMAQADIAKPWWLSMGAGIGEVEVVGHDRSQLVSELLADAGYPVEDVISGEDDGTRTVSLSGGYQLSRYVGITLTYQDAGKTEGGFVASLSAPEVGQLQGSIASDYRTLSAAAIGYWPILDWLELQGELGVHHWRHDFELKGWDTASGAPIAAGSRDSGYGALFGAGVGFKLLPWLDISLFWERFNGVEGEAGIDVKSLQAKVRF